MTPLRDFLCQSQNQSVDAEAAFGELQTLLQAGG
jgi:hypothetical protein